MRIKVLLLFSIFSPLFALKILNISKFTYVNSIFYHGVNLYVGSDGGVYVYNTVSRKLEASYITDNPVELVIYDPFTSKVFFTKFGALYSWNPFTNFVSFLTNVGTPTSIGVDDRHIYVESGGRIVSYSKTGIYEGTRKGDGRIFWSGEKVNLKKSDSRLLPLAPYYVHSEGMGNIEFTVFYPFMHILWIGTEGLGLYKYDLQMHIIRDSIRVGLPGKEVYVLEVVKDTLWIGSNRGLTYVYGSYWNSYTREGTFEIRGDRIVDINGDNGNVWFLSTEELILFHDGKLHSYRLPFELEDTKSMSLDNGTVWLCADNGIFRFNTVSMRYEKVISDGHKYFDVCTVHGKVFIATDRGLVLYREGSLYKIQDPYGWLDWGAINLNCYMDTLFVLTSRGIVSYDTEKSFFYIETPFEPKENSVHSLKIEEGRIYVATDRGLHVMERIGGTWILLSESDGLPSTDVWSIASYEGKLYIGTAEGLSILEW